MIMRKVPDWVFDQIIYQIFPDRFYNSDPARSFPLPEKDCMLKSWTEPVQIPPRGRDFYGGNLEGIRQKLPYLRDLGVTTLYLTPIFLARSNHKYDTEDYFQIDPQFGSLADFDRLRHETRAAGFRLLLDGVFNHTGEAHPWYNARRTYAEPGAFQTTRSRFHSYFKQKDGQISFWRGHRFMPELNLRQKEVLQAMIEDEQSVVKFWLRRGIDGWRLDCANDLGLRLMGKIRNAMTEVNPDSYQVGEVMCFGADWVKGKRCDGVMNYYLGAVIRNFLKGVYTAGQIQTVMNDLLEFFPYDKLLASWNMLTSHDKPRLRHIFKDDMALIRLAGVLQFTLPGLPFIYYGEEIGMDGGPDPDNRRPMIWDESQWDMKMRQFFKKLITIRLQNIALRRGQFRMLYVNDAQRVLVFARWMEESPADFAIIAVNAGTQTQHSMFPVPISHSYDSLILADQLGPTRIPGHDGAMTLDIPALSAMIVTPTTEYV